MLIVQSFVNSPVTSNCYVLFDKTISKDCIIIDPGSRDEIELFAFIESEDLIPKYIFLTHEHFDHCWGVNQLVERYHIPIVCSSLCSKAIKDKKRNCSVFYDNVGFTIKHETISVESIDNKLRFGETFILLYNTPGHTNASICMVADKFLFTGDLLIKEEKTITRLPTGSVELLKESMAVISTLKGKGLTVYPGHGDGFSLDKYDLNKCLEGKANEEHSYI